ncbi:hypothetical protein MMC08_007191 [Hypocenomyce scalaris]|nr:hypothetical protein [Hypocenomyce scalaris]
MVAAIALIIEEHQSPFVVDTVELEPLQPDEVLVKLKATGVCHTDVKIQRGDIPQPLPMVVGHEGAGVVQEVGSAVKDLIVGDHVLLSYNSCGKCRNCKRNQTYQCVEMNKRNFGAQRPDGSQAIKWKGSPANGCFFGQSSFSNPAVVQVASCVKVDKSLPLEALAPLGCGAQTGAGSVFHVVKPVENETRSLVIFGIGGVGSAALMAAHILATDYPGVLSTIIAVDLTDSRLELAKQLGATHVINPSKVKSVIDTVIGITGGEGADAAVDCTGAISVINDMFYLVGSGGTAITLGVPASGLKASVEVSSFVKGCKTYRASHQGNSYSKEFLPFLADLYMKGRLPLDLVQKQYRAADINQAVKEMSEGSVVKPVLLWD